MKNLKTILLVVATTNILYAQDTIYTKAGKTINAKVYEVTQNEIRYQSSSNLEGPMYTIDKNQVSSIEYKNGTKDAFKDEPANVNQPQANQPNNNNSNNNNSGTYSKDGSYYADDVYNQGDPNVVNNNYYSSDYGAGYYNPGVSLNFMFGMPSLFWGVPYYAGPWGGWPYYRSYYRPYWAYNYYRPWGWNGYAWGGYGNYGWGWRGNHVGGYGGYHGGHYNGGYHNGGGYYGGHRGGGGGYYGPRGSGHRTMSSGNGGFNGGGHGFGGGGFHGGGGGYHGGGGGGFHGGGGGGHGGGGHGGGHR